MKQSTLVFIFMLSSVFCRGQLSPASVTGNHAGFLVWEKALCSLELRANSVYVLTTYNIPGLETQTSVKGQWKIEGDKIVLIDVTGAQTVLCKQGNEWYVLGANGISCAAKFQFNKSVQDYWLELKKYGC